MFKKLNMRGVSHHFLLPVLAVLFVAGIGGFIMQRSSSAATITKNCSAALPFGRYTHNPAYAKYAKYKPCVKAIQRKVGAKADGIYGNYTQSQVKIWQKKHGIKNADGVVGKVTWGKMGLSTKYKVTTKAAAPAKKAAQTPAQKNAAARKDCLGDNGSWNSKTDKCTYPTKFSYCDWGKRSDHSYQMKLTCRTTSVVKGSAKYDSLWRRNDNAWNACRSYMRDKFKNPTSASVERYCKDSVVKP